MDRGAVVRVVTGRWLDSRTVLGSTHLASTLVPCGAGTARTPQLSCHSSVES